MFIVYIKKSIKRKNLELEAICKALKKAGIIMSLLSVTHGKYSIQVPDVVACECYECFSFQENTPSSI